MDKDPGAKDRRPLRKWAVNLSLVGIGCLVAVILVESALRWYNPFPFRIRLGKIVLLTNITFTTENHHIKKLSRQIIHSKNSLGLRGDPPPRDFRQYLTIITVGGSTTECFYLADGHAWPDILGKLLQRDFRRLWINNAGLDGHSTFGHLQLMTDYLIKLQPKCVLFMVGINDIGREDLSAHDQNLSGLDVIQRKSGLWARAARYSEFCSLLVNLSRYLQGYRRGLVHQEIILENQEHLGRVDQEWETGTITMHREKYLEPFALRLRQLLHLTREHGIIPVLITQPALHGDAIDPTTGVDLANIRISGDYRGKLLWDILELYNGVTRQVGRETKTPVIDLASKMPKDSRYYYDYFHLTDEGAAKVAEIIDHQLSPFLAMRFPEFQRHH